jgi:hypothetical protein
MLCTHGREHELRGAPMNGNGTGRVTSKRTSSRRPLPEVARRLRVAFPELWTRYELLASVRDPNGSPQPPPLRNRPVGSG